MRTLFFTLNALLIVVIVGTGVGEPIGPVDPPVWVRTVDGWEPLSELATLPQQPRPLHPLVVAAFQLFTSVGVLVAAASD